jgi:predicted nucleic acid-binding protein
MISPPYVDTSALAKWYLNEPGSEEFEAFITRQSAVAISRLTVVEFRCLLARRRRSGDIDGRTEERIFSVFEDDIRGGYLTVHRLEDEHAIAAAELIHRLRAHPLRSLDALHLAIALSLDTARIATADRTMALAAQAVGIKAVRFD